MNMIIAAVVQILLIALNAVFAGAEIAVISVNETKMKKMAEEGNKRAKRLLSLTKDQSKVLSTIQVAITLAGLLGSAFAADSFAEIAVECVTNAVRHGYATRVQFHFFQNDCWRMTVTDNGIPPAGPIREGGGIGGMRRRVRQLGGRMELYTVPRFRIELSVPKEAVEK